MKRHSRASLALFASLTIIAVAVTYTDDGVNPQVRVRQPVHFDVSRPLATLRPHSTDAAEPECEEGCGVSPASAVIAQNPAATPTVYPVDPRGAAIEQTAQGGKPAVLLLESFDGHGFGLVGPHGTGGGNNPSDNSVAVGPDHIVETVNSRVAVYTKKGAVFDKTGTVLFGPVSTNVLFSGFGGECERAPNGDAVVRYDQLARRWFYVMPLFRRAVTAPGQPQGKYGMCYALSTGPNPMGPYYRYYFERELFPDYPRPAVWPDGYYIPTSTGDDVIEKHACIVDRNTMLNGGPATEQCIIIKDVNFLNNADLDGQTLPPPGAPNIMMAAGGTQLKQDFDDDGIYAWNVHVDWKNPANTKAIGPIKIPVAPYNYLCNGQLTRCVPQPGTETRLDAQGDKIMARLVYRNVRGRESVVAVHSVNTSAGAGGVRWYEFRLNAQREPVLHQQGTYAPDRFYRWMASPGIDREGNIGIGYSFGGTPNYPGQRFAGRLADDSLGRLTFHETLLVEGKGSQQPAFRWEDYTQLSMDPVDDCTMWYVGDYLKAGAPSYTTRIGAFRLPGCLTGTVSGTAYFDANHNGWREPNEPGMPGWQIDYASTRKPTDKIAPPSGKLTTDARGDFNVRLPADRMYFDPTYTFSAASPTARAWSRSNNGTAFAGGAPLRMINQRYTVALRDGDDVAQLSFGYVCTVPNTGGSDAGFWAGEAGKAVLAGRDQQPAEPARGGRGGGRGGRGGADAGWRTLLNNTRRLVIANGSQFLIMPGPFEGAYDQLRTWLTAPASSNASAALSVQLAVATLNTVYGNQGGQVTVLDPVTRDWPTVNVLLGRINTFITEHPNTTAAGALKTNAEAYRTLLLALNRNQASVTPQAPTSCPAPV